MFNVTEYIHDLKPTEEDMQTIKEAKEVSQVLELLCDDAYLARALHWGVATAMENQLTYIGGNLLPKAEARLNRLAGNGYLSEGDVSVSWYANEDKPHVNEDITIDDQVTDQERFIDQVNLKLHTAAIMFVAFVNAHDELSHTLNQLTYGAIKAKSASKRERKAS